MQCKYIRQCLNSDNCVLCTDYRLLKTLDDKARQAKQARYKVKSAKTDIRNDSKESWNDLEDTVTAALNAMPTNKQYEAQRQIRSGAIWFMPGDIADDVMLLECKERSTIDAQGKSQIVIKKDWLDKILNEADGQKYPALAFRYKGSEDIYFVQRFEILCELVTEIKHLRKEIQRLKEVLI